MPKYRVTADALRIRSGPGITYAITGMLLRDDVVEGGELANDWLKVITEDNKSGWSHRGYLELIDETPLPPAQVVYRDCFAHNDALVATRLGKIVINVGRQHSDIMPPIPNSS